MRVLGGPLVLHDAVEVGLGIELEGRPGLLQEGVAALEGPQVAGVLGVQAEGKRDVALERGGPGVTSVVPSSRVVNPLCSKSRRTGSLGASLGTPRRPSTGMEAG